jgi:pimeloyl-ACP methyl ester carboxylesterase
MNNLRIYGDPPYSVAVVHGGPGAPGEMAPVARELFIDLSVLEPLQTADTLDGQVVELKIILEGHADLPVTLIGWSYGAWLCYILAAKYPDLVKKLILICSGPFEEEYAEQIMSTRTDRLDDDECSELADVIMSLNEPGSEDTSGQMARLIELISRADSFETLPYEDEIVEFQHAINQKVWAQASSLRRSGILLELGKSIRCPVVVIHGDHDPHPSEGVQKPLSGIIKDFRFILLEKCGHKPWIERNAKDRFYEILKAELS